MSRPLHVTIDDDLCKSSRNCVYAAPGTFELAGALGEATHVLATSSDDEATIVAAALSCPQAAITVVDAQTGADLLEETVTRSTVSWRTPGSGT